jgi:topoisomerase-4 subunit A
MTQTTMDFAAGSGGGDDTDAITLAHYAERAYLEYALSVVKGRALPDVCDGQKPVQRRILYAMQRMGLGYTGTAGAKPVKSARVVGDVLGRFHPHGDQAAYDALVRMAQDFAQRYPLIDGQGNFGSRDGDGAAAMRYTEARLAPISRLLLDEIDEGTVEFVPNYDGSTEEPRQLPARLPFVLLNGASGIAVGLATEVPSHNLREVAAAAVALIRDAKLSTTSSPAWCPGPDFPGGGQVISRRRRHPRRVCDRPRQPQGAGALEDRGPGARPVAARRHRAAAGHQHAEGARRDRGAHQPKVKAGKKNLSAEQTQLKVTLLAVLDAVRDESSKDAPVRLVFEPKTSRIEQQDLIRTLLAHTSLETSAPINLTMVGADGRPTQKSLRQMLVEWIDFRMQTVQRRTRHRLAKVLDRIHVLEGRQLVLLNIDEVIRIIRHSDEPKPALIERFKLSERQAEDILEIRLRQLARLEAIKIEQELEELRTEQGKLEDILGSPTSLKRTVIREIEGDARQYGDERRTLIQAEKKAIAEMKVIDEPVTAVVSLKGWVRALKGHEVEAASLQFKAGDGLYGTFACRTVDTLLVFGSNGRVYSVGVNQLPGGRGDGQPITTLIDLESGTQPAHYFAGHAQHTLLLANTGGFGLLARVGDLVSQKRGGKSFLSLEADDKPLPPSLRRRRDAGRLPHARGRLLVFPLDELKLQPNGGRGLTLIDLDPKDALVSVAALRDRLQVLGTRPRRQAEGRGARRRGAGRLRRQARPQGPQAARAEEGDARGGAPAA